MIRDRLDRHRRSGGGETVRDLRDAVYIKLTMAGRSLGVLMHGSPFYFVFG